MANRLADESSPYLRQHADNPVDWQPWGPDALAEAARRDVPVLLSVGYSSCHWCHVMAHESFEDPEVAAVMNGWFVPVKVDREERPDIDAIYMEATQAMTGRGGWPMTVFMSADGRPFYCGTYFPPTQRGGMPGFVQLMEAVNDAWTNRRGELEEQAATLTQSLDRDIPRGPSDGELPGAPVLDAATESLLSALDPQWGGFGRAPKFPQTMGIAHLLRQHSRTGSAAALQAVTTSLDAMASGGMVDLIGGGFSRYSVDEQWLVPHFEKMLYDNALLARVYAQAHVATGEPRWAQVVTEAIDYVVSDLSHPDGARYSAEGATDSLATEDADHAEEGAFYVFTPEQVEKILAEAGLEGVSTAACEWWGITTAGNFEGASIPNRLHARGDWERPAEIDAARRALREARARRPRPGLDDKVLTEWNALWVTAVAEAGATMGREAWVSEAERTARFLLDNLRRADGRWLRSWQAGVGARHLAYGSDHAALVEAFVALYEATGRQSWLREAESTAEALLELFWDPAGGIFTTGEDAEALLVRPREVMDNATPSASSMAAVALRRLEALTGEPRWGNHARQVLAALGPLAAQAPLGFGHLLAAVHDEAVGITEVVVTGDRPDLVEVAQRRFAPGTVLAWGERGDGPLWDGRDESGADGRAYVCRNFTCEAPVSDPDSLRSVLHSSRKS